MPCQELSFNFRGSKFVASNEKNLSDFQFISGF
jgi:hypothetical protein